MTFNGGMRRSLRTSVILIGGAVVMAGGCQGGTEMAPVSGQVTMSGQPVRGVFVVFHPQPPDGSIEAPTRPAMAQVDEDGRYSLSTNVEGDGAAVGKHKVTIIAVKRGAQPPGNVPQDYVVEVKPGPNTHDLELTPGA
jgi:hypothetical protein